MKVMDFRAAKKTLVALADTEDPRYWNGCTEHWDTARAQLRWILEHMDVGTCAQAQVTACDTRKPIARR